MIDLVEDPQARPSDEHTAAITLGCWISQSENNGTFTVVRIAGLTGGNITGTRRLAVFDRLLRIVETVDADPAVGLCTHVASFPLYWIINTDKVCTLVLPGRRLHSPAHRIRRGTVCRFTPDYHQDPSGRLKTVSIHS